MKKNLLALFCLISLININAQISITLGPATIVSGNTDSSPINIYYKSHHCQILYTAAELNAAGWVGAGTISKLGFNIFSTTSEPLPNFSVKIKNTINTDVAIYDNTGLTTVYTNTMYQPTAGGFELFNLSNTFLWDGTSNILVDVCFDRVSQYTQTGQLYMYNYTNVASEYQYKISDSDDLCAFATDQSNTTYKPQIRFEMISATPCTGTPNSGNAVSSSTLVCPSTSFDLSLSNGSNQNGINFQWQSSNDLGVTWVNLGVSQADWNYLVPNITATTYYRCVSTCSNSALSNTSTPIVVNSNPLMNCYCTPNYSLTCTGDNVVDFSIANVALQPSNCDFNGYSDSTSSAYTVINLTAGNSYSLQTNIINSTNGGNMVAGAWIDYNQNGVFDGDEFIYLGYGGTQIYSANFTVPITAPSGVLRMRLKVDACNANIGSVLSACDNNNSSTFGQIIDYKVNMTAAPACTLNPSAGNATASQTSVCVNQPINLDLTNNSVASGILYQWQSSLNGTVWSNLGPAQNTIPYSISSQSVSTYYRCISTCTNSALTDISTPITVTQNAITACYCLPDDIDCANTNFSNVSFSTLSDNPVCNTVAPNLGYSLYSASTLTVNANQSYTFSATFNTQSNAYVGLWIDYDQNGIFDNNEYSNVGNSTAGTLTTSISIPINALNGNTRMRLKMESSFGYSITLSSCTAIYSEGQTLDYPIYIIGAPPCSGAPNAGDASTSVSTTCEDSPFTLNLINNSIVSNILYQWQYSTDNANWFNLGGSQQTIPFTVSSQTVTTYYKCELTCVTSGSTATSTSYTVNQNLPTACYCIPPESDCVSGDEINTVVFSNLTNTSTCSSMGYENYATNASVPSATVTTGSTYTLDVTLGNIFNQKVAAWIDYNQDGEFDTDEYTMIGTSMNSSNLISGSITIPANATPGITRLRVRNNTNFMFSDNEACETGANPPKMALLPPKGYGETEDYSITIVNPDCNTFLPNSNQYIISGNFVPICSGQTVLLNVMPNLPIATGFTYEWYTAPLTGTYTSVGTNSNSISSTPTVTTYYYSEILCNGNPFTITDTVLINVNSITTAPVVTNASCNGQCDGSIFLNATASGSASINYNWMPSQSTTSNITNLCSGSYTANLTSTDGCSISEVFNITQPGVFSASILANNSSICEQLKDTIKSTIVGGIAPFNYNWIQLPTNSVSTNPDYTYTTSVGTFSYVLSVTGANGCVVNSNTVSVTVNPSSNISGTVTTNTVTPVAGRVVLYKYLPFFTKFDSVAGQNIGAAGDYNFISFTAGRYIVKAIPTATNMQIAYGDSAINWLTAKQIIHGCTVNDIQNINVKSLQTFVPGPGTLTGIITETVGYGNRPFGTSGNESAFKPTAPGGPIGGIVVKGGRNPGGQMFVQTISSTDPTPGVTGTYTLSGLPYGDYFVLVDIPGLDTNNTYHVKITPNDTVFNNLDFTVDSIQINPINITAVGIKEIYNIENKIKIYPNPASNYVTIQYNLQNSSLVKIELFDILGKSVKTLLPLTQQPKDSYKTSWHLDDIKSGLYFVKMNIDGIESTIKLSITN